MPKEGGRRKSNPRLYDILIVPVGKVGKTLSFRTDRLKMVLFALLAFFVSVGITLAILVYTPLAIYVPIPNAGLERHYGRQIVDLQQRLDSLADGVLLLKDYNTQLRKALGEGGRDSTDARVVNSSIELDNDAGRAPAVTEARVKEEEPSAPAATEEANDLDLVAPETVPVAEQYHAELPLLTPVEGFVTQGFDPSRKHYGIDFAAARGPMVYAAAAGRVIFSGWTYEDGNMLMVSHGGGYITVYKHNQTLLKSAPAVVKRGEPIALLGSSGKTSLGPHLHFEVLKNGAPQDPNQYLLSPAGQSIQTKGTAWRTNNRETGN